MKKRIQEQARAAAAEAVENQEINVFELAVTFFENSSLLMLLHVSQGLRISS